MNELKEALAIAASQDDAWRRSAIDVDSQRRAKVCSAIIRYPGFRVQVFSAS